ncbi:hypothetical protein NECAME_03958 [Necator americanus]|uniref:Uncharacterized protein n=1 Tax=Necator americanus TaxID=51031 RepID=W2SYD7_NECAM|nr:hypothetical protein NECAME_03958 [Necator americanus]ETN74645.1 hypothetical protein NECAME_03958 [Necator americanus]
MTAIPSAYVTYNRELDSDGETTTQRHFDHPEESPQVSSVITANSLRRREWQVRSKILTLYVVMSLSSRAVTYLTSQLERNLS